jgi:hypothetical protein
VSGLLPDETPILLDLPPEARLRWNTLCDSREMWNLDDDLIWVELPGGMGIDVSWYPVLDPSGRYYVVVVKGDWDNPLAHAETTDPHEAAGLVGEFARRSIGGGPRRERL